MSIRKMLLHARMEYLLWLTNPRISIFLVILVLIHSLVIQPLHEASEQIGYPFHLLEPIVALCNSITHRVLNFIGRLPTYGSWLFTPTLSSGTTQLGARRTDVSVYSSNNIFAWRDNWNHVMFLALCSYCWLQLEYCSH